MFTVRIGLPLVSGSLPGFAQNLDAPTLVSANALWNHKAGRFRKPASAIMDLDVALDSAGFVAMNRYGGFRWNVEQYVGLAGAYSWTWWAQMDCCCEPEVAKDAQEISRRVDWSTMLLWHCLTTARNWREQGAFWLQDPMPVLQGWQPAEYRRCAQMYSSVLDRKWPDMVGIGSVCRRNLTGPDGLFNVIEALQEEIPEHVGFHLFGVKGAALEKLKKYPRVVSIDSSAWDFRARMAARDEDEKYSMAWRGAHMKRWYEKQLERLKP
jgi:hypothetical protein